MPPINPKRQIARGPGSTDPEFTSTVAVQQAGPVAREQPTQFDQLEQALTNIGGLVAGGLRQAASISNNLASLKNQAVANQERRMAGVRRNQAAISQSLQNRRLSDVETQQIDLLNRADQHDPEWLFKQARIGFTNAASQEEKSMWAPLVEAAHKDLLEFQEDEEQRERNKVVQEFAVSGRTAKQAVTEMVSNLQANPDLQAELMGNGTGIHERTQNWILAEAAEVAPELFEIRENDPLREVKLEQRDQLVSSLIDQSLRVGDSLVRQHTDRQDSLAFQTGADLVSSQLVSYFEGKVGTEEIAPSINEVGRLHFSHLTQSQQTNKMRGFIADAIDAATAGEFGTNVADIEERVGVLLDSSPFNPVEKAAIEAQASERLARLSSDNFMTHALRAQQSRTVEIPILGQEGVLATRSVQDPNAAAALAAPDPQTGLTEYDLLADRTILEAGLNRDAEDLSPTELRAVATIRDQASRLNAAGQQAISRELAADSNLRAVLSGDPAGNAGRAYEDGLIRRTFSSSAALQPHQIRSIQDREKELVAAGRTASDEARSAWDGSSPLERTPETRTLRESVMSLEAEAWSGAAVNGAHELPSALVADFKQQWQGGDPEAMIDVVYFASALSPSRLDQFMDGFADGTSAGFALRNAIHNFKLGANNVSFQKPVEDLMATARQQMEAADPSEFLEQPTPFTDFTGQRNEIVASQAFAEVLAVNTSSTLQRLGNTVLPGDPFGNSSEDHRERMSELQAAFLGPSSDIMDRMFGMWSTRVQTTQDDPATAANWVWQTMRDEGYRFTNIGGRATIVQDPLGHFGPDDPRQDGLSSRVSEWASTAIPTWQRAAIGQALGLEPKDIPMTWAELYASDPTRVNPALVQDSEGRAIDLTFEISDGTNRDAQFTLRKTPAAYGGIVVQPRAADGRLLPVIRANRTVTYRGPDGREYVLREGEPLSVFSQHIQDAQRFVPDTSPIPDAPKLGGGIQDVLF